MSKKTDLKIKALEEKTVDLENRWKRALADYDNLEKRWLKERQAIVRFANVGLLVKLLSVVDDLNLCQQHNRDQGLGLICQRLGDILRSEGLERMSSLGQKFDPEKMEAVETVSGPKDKVIEVVAEGYQLDNKVIRPAKVKVGNSNIRKEQKCQK